MRSNSLDVELKKKEKELKAHEQEIADQQELHELTVKELDLVKAAHNIAVTECQQLKTKVCVCVCERERERQRQGEGGMEGGSKGRLITTGQVKSVSM